MFLLKAVPVPAQIFGAADKCIYTKAGAFTQRGKTTIASPDELKYDVRHIHIDVAVDNTSVAISGNSTTTATVTEGNFALYVCELNKLLTVDSVHINGQNANFNRNGNLVQVFMPAVLQQGDIFSATVFYHGMPDAGSVFFFQSGVNNAPAVDWNSPVTYTLSEPYNSKDWWPCKQYLFDKIDSADIWITVPDSLKAGSNGLLQKITSLPGNKSRYEWKTTYPAAYYLLSFAVADYEDYSYSRMMPDGKSVLVQNFIYNRDHILDTFKNGIDSTGDMLYYFSEIFGTYPFHEEKYGHCMAPVFGGMEHQTMTTLHNFRSPLVAHELAHQWFGNNVTCASWRDIWLNEGIATYAEYLHAEKFWDEADALTYMQYIHNVVLQDTVVSGSIYIPEGDTVNPYRIFDNRLSYKKAGAVMHMLRFVINNDEVFFSILKQYQQNFAGGHADTEAFRLLAEQLSGIDLDEFFNEWIYGEGYPVHTVQWNYTENKFMLQIQQEGSVPSSVPFFDIPVEIKLLSAKGDTIIRLGSSRTISTFIDITRTIDDIVFDPYNKILNKATVERDYSLGLSTTAGDVVVYPNPTKDGWKVYNIAAGNDLVLTDLSGKVLWQATANNAYGMYIPAAGYARGMYILYVKDNKNNTISKKISRL